MSRKIEEEMNRWSINWIGKIYWKNEETIVSTPNRLRVSLWFSIVYSISAFNFKGSILSFGNSFSRRDRAVCKHSTIPLAKSFSLTSPVNRIAPSSYLNSPAKGSRKVNYSAFSIRDRLKALRKAPFRETPFTSFSTLERIS